MKGNILVIDDEYIVLKSCESILSPSGYKVDTTQSPTKGLEMIKDTKYDIVITDIMMPEMDGLEVIRRIREFSTDIHVILVTGYPSQESIRDALKLGIVDYLPKPFSPSLLLDSVGKAMEKGVTIADETKGMRPDEIVAALDRIIDSFKGRRGSLLPVLHQAKKLLGDLTQPVQRHIAHRLNLPVSEVYGVVSFYTAFSGKRSARDTKPKGKHHVKVCMGPACFVKRAEEIAKRMQDALGIELGGIREDKSFSLEGVRCLGACALAPVVLVDKDTYGSIEPNDAEKLLEKYK